MNHLFREMAPVSDLAWDKISEEAKRVLTLQLVARRLVDFVGPKGWEYSALNLGRSQPIASPVASGMDARLRHVQPLSEFRSFFELQREELENIDRGAEDPDLGPVIEAAKNAARAEDAAVFRGYASGGIAGVLEKAPRAEFVISEHYEDYPSLVAQAMSLLLASGVGGPYALALSPRLFIGMMRAVVGGVAVVDMVKSILQGPVLLLPVIEGGLVISLRGGDFLLAVGQDFSIGYHSHNEQSVRLFIQESFTFQVANPQAAVSLSLA